MLNSLLRIRPNFQMSRGRNFCFTSFKDAVLAADTKYICWGEEICPTTGKAHLQGYVEFAESVSFATVKRRLGDPAVHLSRRNGTQAQAIAYCKKDGIRGQPTFREGFVFHEFGVKAAPGKRSDLEAVRVELSHGHGMRRIIESGATYVGLRFAEKWLTYLEPGRGVDSVPDVRWYWGSTGTGKTRAALAEASASVDVGDVWWTNGGLQWFDGMLSFVRDR